jgi:glycosyltransferase involved in cell wall biosynthesis
MNPANFYRKGIDLILETAKTYTEATFTIIGDSKGMSYGEIPENVKIMPFVPYEKLRQEYAKHEFYFQLSLMEGFPSAPCEAMLCECIPITSNVGALPTIVGDTGFILEKKNFAMLSAMVKDALNSDKSTLAKNARKRIVTNFPPETRLKLVEVINKYC